MKIEENRYYHIYNRGNNKNLIFFEENNYAYFINQFTEYLIPYCEVYAYCLMPNHFHFFIKVVDKISFEKGVKNFFISYSKSVNKKYNRVGSLFQGRYKAVEISSDSYYTRIITYIHQNPVVAGLVERLENYKYSSYEAYLSTKPTLLKKAVVLDWFKTIDNFIISHQINN